MLEQIVHAAKAANKHMLVLAAPRTGTHALCQTLTKISNARNFGEICKTGYCEDPWTDIDNFVNSDTVAVASVVQLTAKITLAENVEKIKQQCVIVNIKRQDLISQFTSWMYFRVLDPTCLYGWHNHTAQKTKVKPGEIVATQEDINQFKVEQMLDEYFLPDFRLCYENVDFSQQIKYRKNQFSFPLPQMFANLDFVEHQLSSWKFTTMHLGQHGQQR